MERIKLTFILELKSDYHIGAGHGIGSMLDSALQRDSDGVPVLRGTTIAGLFRDGLWRLLQIPPCHYWYEEHEEAEEKWKSKQLQPALAYCEKEKIEKRCRMCQIFGTPQSPKSWHFSSARPVGAENILPNDKEAKWIQGRTASQQIMRNRVDLRTRRTSDGHLFLQEEGDQRLRFQFTITCDEGNPFVEDHATFLVAAARMIRRFGSSRRRGRGACAIYLVNDDGVRADDGYLKQFRELLNKPENQIPAESNQASDSVEKEYPKPVVNEGDPLKRIRVILRTDEPVLLSWRAEAGNMFDTRKFISGNTLLGALAKRCAARLGVLKHRQSFNPHGQAYSNIFIELFLRGQIRFGTLYPAFRDEDSLYPAVPAPLDLFTCKAYPGHEVGTNDLTHHGWRSGTLADERLRECQVCKNEYGENELGLKVEDGYPIIREVPTRDSQRKQEPFLRDELHPRIDPESQRVVTGDLYGYTALDSGQYFVGEICCANEAVWMKLKEHAELPADNASLPLRLGKATRRGYGRVSVSFEEIAGSNGSAESQNGEKKATTSWIPLPLEERVASETTRITMTLLTDAILPDPWGRFHQKLDESNLTEIFKSRLAVKGVRTFCQGQVIDNFSNVIGLPRWRDLGLEAGTAVGFELDQDIGLDELRKVLYEVEEEGIGLRRNEGFGCVVFNHPIYEGFTLLDDYFIEIPTALLLGSTKEEDQHTLCQEDESLEDWQRELPRAKLFQKRRLETDSSRELEAWQALARWLYANADMPHDKLKEEILSFGDPVSLTLVPRQEKGFQPLIEAVEKIKTKLSEAIAEIEKREDRTEYENALNELQSALEYLENYSSCKKIVDHCNTASENLAETDTLKKVRNWIDEVSKKIDTLQPEERVLFELNDLLNETAQEEQPVRVRKIQMLADRIAATVQNVENPS